MSDVIIKERFNAPIEKTWAALTEVSKMKEWYFDIPEFKAKAGFKFSFEEDCDGQSFVHLCEIIEVFPKEKLQYTWSYEGYAGSSLLTFDLERQDDLTEVTLTHSGVTSFPTELEFTPENFKIGWSDILRELHYFLAKDTDRYCQAEMMIRRPISEVFNAIVDPEIITNFWFTKSTGRLETGKKVAWTWEPYNFTLPVEVNSVVENEKILMSWGEGVQRSHVEWKFAAVDDTKAHVVVTNYGLQSTGQALLHEIRDKSAGFMIVLAGAKAYLEHNIKLNLVFDKMPH